MLVGIYDFGSIGRLVAREAIERGHEVVGVVDIDESVVGRDVGEVLGVGSIGVEVSRDVSVLVDADVVIHATGSYLDRVYNQIASVLSMGVDVVSTCETLAYPYYRYPVLAIRLNELARDSGAVIVGTGINPGFLLDTLVAVVASSVTRIRYVKAVRSVDALKRRESFKRKIGLGLDTKTFEDKMRRGELTGHVGYAESVYLIAHAGDLQLTRVVEGQEPVIADETIEERGTRIDKGLCKGVKGYGAGYLGDKEVVRVELQAYAKAPEYEEIIVVGKDYAVTWRSSGTPGDPGTDAVILNVAEKIHKLSPGLHLMTDLLPFKIRFSV
ncbi:dihydrodipicolinate reductase [Ignisphaera sp. 4213-co]|uniref:Dihydrodipicolinate reductase n=1 Tax=Ignisphaera cupida TaxID=3050454 RepID=A0ABD4Z649_9CREN|nr:dihydrodipicolinate reductase [Ignisphaera sp. 4213-co]MDK6028792.1 dihydrodipicolinate reductase [Ignisphaera sp. 4213-co]